MVCERVEQISTAHVNAKRLSMLTTSQNQNCGETESATEEKLLFCLFVESGNKTLRSGVGVGYPRTVDHGHGSNGILREHRVFGADFEHVFLRHVAWVEAVAIFRE